MEDPAVDQGTIDELAALADELLEQATEVRRQWSELGETLGVEPPSDGARVVARPDDGAPGSAPAEGTPLGGSEADPMRLVALDMMLSGRSRDEVRDYLRATFGDEPPGEVLDEVFSQYGS
jgi:hypothetical protein